MKFSAILLIIIAGAGLLHGLYCAVFLGVIRKKKSLPVKLLALVLVLFGYRVGKSIALYFMEDLEFFFIFSGLATMLLIGPLLYAYTQALIKPSFELKKAHLPQAIPFVIALAVSPFVTEEWFKAGRIIWMLATLIFIYLHLAAYIGLSWRSLAKVKQQFPKKGRTQSQDAIFKWLNYVILGISVIWGSYVINILDDILPYIVGPVIYSISIYLLSIKAMQMKAVDMDAKVFQAQKNGLPQYKELLGLMEQDKLYLQADLNLAKAGKLVGMSGHEVSGIINEHAHKNFNEFINHYRIQHAKQLLADESHAKFTISSIAYEAGFNSLSSFNSAFKKFEGMTPSAFRKGAKTA